VNEDDHHLEETNALAAASPTRWCDNATAIDGIPIHRS
jgi:hypothetical protein